jgi:Smg protein
MKETVLDVLMYLFDNYEDEDVKMTPDQDALKDQLVDAGFAEREVGKAFDWLEALATQKDNHYPSTTDTGTSALRIYHGKELEKLDTECRGFLLFLEQAGVLDNQNREVVIDRVMALESEDIDLQQLKWVVLMVLFNQPGKEAVITWMEDIVMDDLNANIH